MNAQQCCGTEFLAFHSGLSSISYLVCVSSAGSGETVCKHMLVAYPISLDLMLGLHYVPGSHGSHGSQKRSSPWGFGHFCLRIQVLLSLTTFSHGLSRYPRQRLDSALGLPRMIVRLLTACHVLL